MNTPTTVPERKRLERRGIPTPPSSQPSFSRSLPAWLVSLIVHSLILTTLTIFWVGTSKGTGGEKQRPVGVAVVYEVAGKSEYYLTGDGQNSDTDAAAESALPSEQSSSQQSASTEELLNDLLPGATAAGSEATSAAGSLGLGEGGGALGGSNSIPKVKTSVFGIEGEGTRFLYVFDSSDSMNGYAGSPLRSAKSELLKSLDSLGPVHQFQIVFYNDSPYPFGGLGGAGPRLLKGEQQSKDEAKRFVRNRPAAGGTQHIDALRMALRMGPDVIFFLTDADTAPRARDIEDLQTRANRIGATIHTIQFGAGPERGGGWIRSLAEGTRGKYRYVDVTKLE